MPWEYVVGILILVGIGWLILKPGKKNTRRQCNNLRWEHDYRHGHSDHNYDDVRR